MTHDEMIEAAGLAIEDQLTLEDGWLVGTPQLKGMCQDFARAAIRVIAPAVLEDLAALEESRSWSVGLKAHEIRALKTRYEL